MKLNKKIILTSIVMLIMLLCTSTVHAAIQSSGGAPAQNYAETWITSVRQMESVGGGFGLSETINSNLTSSSGSNNIDVHMQKNTEYGAMAILSASSYGNPNKITNGKTTTGNETGIVINFKNPSNNQTSYEWTASTFWQNGVIGSKKSKYRDYYKGDTAKIGDATLETSGWHGGNSYLLNSYETNNSIYRNIWGNTIFEFAYTTDDYTYATRCVVIVGEGI